MASNDHLYLALLFVFTVALACICDFVTAAGPQRIWTQDPGRTIITEGTETSQSLVPSWKRQHFDSRWTSQQRFEPRWATQRRPDPSWTPQQRFDPIWTPPHRYNPMWTPRHFDYRPQYSRGGGPEVQRTPAESMWTATAGSRTPEPISAAVPTSSEAAVAQHEAIDITADDDSGGDYVTSSPRPSVITAARRRSTSVTRASLRRRTSKKGVTRAQPKRTPSTKGAGVWPSATTTTTTVSASAVPILACGGDIAAVRCGTIGPYDWHEGGTHATTEAVECTTACTPSIDNCDDEYEYATDSSGDLDFGCRSGWTHLHILAIIGVVFITSVCLAEYCKSNQCRPDTELNEIAVHVHKLNCACKATYKCCELPTDLRPSRSF